MVILLLPSKEIGQQKGHDKPTRAIPFDKPETIPSSELGPEIKGSKDFLNEPAIKEDNP